MKKLKKEDLKKGDKVIYYSVMKENGDPFLFSGKHTTIISEPFISDAGILVCYVECTSGYVAVSNIKKI